MILGMTFHMGIRTAFIDYKDKIDDFMAAATFLSILSAFSLSMLIIILVVILKINVNLALVMMCLIEGFSSAMAMNYSMYLMMKLDYKKRGLLLILPNLIINIVSIIAIIYIFKTNQYLGKIIPSSIVNALFGFGIIAIILRKSKTIINTTYWKYALSVSLPIILHGLSLTILSQSDRIMITALVGASEAGVYSLIYNLSMIASVVSLSLEGIWVPWFTKKLSERSIEQINDKGKIYISVMTFVTIAIILISPEILRLMAPKEYWHGEMIIPPIILSNFVIFIYTIYVNIEHYHKKTRRIAMNTMVAATSNIILNYIFIPKYGMYAAAFTTLISYLISLFIHYKFARRIETQLFPLKIVIFPVFLILVNIGIFYFFIDSIAVRWGALVIISIALFIKEKRNIIHSLKHKND